MRGTGVGFWSVAALEFAPAALLNFAAAFAVATLLRSGPFAAAAAEASVAAGFAVSALAWWAMRRVGKDDCRLSLPAFDQSPLELSGEPLAELDELLLTDEVVSPNDELLLTDEVVPPTDELLLTDVFVTPFEKRSAGDNELLLDDILGSLGSDSRVVRLFDPKAGPTAGELQRRIDRHLASEAVRLPPPDASAELHEAIAALRQSLR